MSSTFKNMGVCGRQGFRNIYGKQENLRPVSMDTQTPYVVFCIFIQVSLPIVLKTSQRGTAKGREREQGAARKWLWIHRGKFGFCLVGKGKPPKRPQSEGADRHIPPFHGNESLWLCCKGRTEERPWKRGARPKAAGWLECAEAAGVTKTREVSGSPRDTTSCLGDNGAPYHKGRGKRTSATPFNC